MSDDHHLPLYMQGPDAAPWREELSARERPRATVGRPNGAGAANQPSGAPGHSAEPVRFKTLAEFCAEYVPLSYRVEPIVRSGSLYTITARTGAGKTAFLTSMGIAVAAGRSEILGLDVEPGRVAYLGFENPDDLRMRMMIAAFSFGIDIRDIGGTLVVLDVRRKPEDVCAELELLSSAGEFALVQVDTLAAFYDGDNVNDAVQGGEFMRRLRPMTRLPGLPSVVIAAHPVKNATEEQLIPYGSGAILNEIDGNLTLWKKPNTGIVSLHWQGKLRGLDFSPKAFRFESLGSPDVLDAKGRQVLLPVMLPASDALDEARQAGELNTDVALLHAMIVNPAGTQTDWAAAIGKHKSNVTRRLQNLRQKKLVDEALGRWRVTAKGKDALAAHES